MYLLAFASFHFIFLALLALIVFIAVGLLIHGRARVIHVAHRLIFLFGLCVASIGDRASGRRVAFNAVMTPNEASRGTMSLIPDNGVLIGFRNAVVKIGSDDRHFTTVTGATDVPRGVLVNDQVDAGEADPGSGSTNYIKKDVAVFGLYPETIPCVASGAIAVDAEVVCDPATPGEVKQLPSASGSYVVIGRSRFTVASAGDPVSLIHHTPIARQV